MNVWPYLSDSDMWISPIDRKGLCFVKIRFSQCNTQSYSGFLKVTCTRKSESLWTNPESFRCFGSQTV